MAPPALPLAPATEHSDSGLPYGSHSIGRGIDIGQYLPASQIEAERTVLCAWCRPHDHVTKPMVDSLMQYPIVQLHLYLNLLESSGYIITIPVTKGPSASFAWLPAGSCLSAPASNLHTNFECWGGRGEYSMTQASSAPHHPWPAAAPHHPVARYHPTAVPHRPAMVPCLTTVAPCCPAAAPQRQMTAPHHPATLPCLPAVALHCPAAAPSRTSKNRGTLADAGELCAG